MPKDNKAFIFYFLMSLILLDFGNQLKKISHNPYIENINNPIFSITHINNTGGAFGLFENSAIPFAIFGIIVILMITIFIYKEVDFEEKIILLSTTLFSAGTLGNLIERLRFGYVEDYIKLSFIDFPVFNSFDIMICLAVSLYLIYVITNNFLIKKDKNDCNNQWW